MKPKHILVVEDDTASTLLFQEIFQDTSYELTFAHSGEDAIIKLENGQNYDLILMDIKLPDFDGFTLLPKIKQTNNNIPIIAQTAYAMSHDKEKCLNLGFTDYISKPVNWEMLLHMIEKYIPNGNKSID